MGHRGFIFNFPDFDSCGELDKVGSELMCLSVENLLSFLKKVCVSGPKGSQKNCPVMPKIVFAVSTSQLLIKIIKINLDQYFR